MMRMEVLTQPSGGTHFSNQSSWLLPPKRSIGWTLEENKAFEEALARFDRDTPERWERVASYIPGKSVDDVIAHYRELENDVSFIEAGLVPFPQYYNSPSNFTLDWETHGFNGFRPGYCLGGKRAGGRGAEQERKKGVPWTEEEHKFFLMGLKKYGRGDWRNISRNYVTSRTPTQVASHAQKYFIRLNSGGKDKRRSSIHDITTVNIPDDERDPSPSAPSIITSQSSTANPPVSDHFSVIVDSKKQSDGMGGGFKQLSLNSDNSEQFVRQSTYGISPYGVKMECDNSFGVGGMFMQMQSNLLPHV
ncbi:hypothetical protein LUZ60_010838 [Juncus effusus]|nr:hypothetical protein LUZ60_010838 [Juncus effusus]